MIGERTVGNAPALTNWMLAVAVCCAIVLVSLLVVVELLVLPVMGVAAPVVVVVGGMVTVDTGTLNVARVISGLCWTGEVAV